MALVKFISGDGIEHEVEESTPAAAIMRQNGFQLLEEVATAAPKPSTRKELIERAKELGVVYTAKTKTADLAAAIEAKEAELDEADDA